MSWSLDRFELSYLQRDGALFGHEPFELTRVDVVRVVPDALLKLLTASGDVLVTAMQTQQLHRSLELLRRAQLASFVE